MEKKSSLGVYSGYSEKIYDGVALHSQYITLKNGIRLAADFYIPTRNGVETTTPHPVIMIYTPYGRRKYTGEVVDGVRQTEINDRIDLPGLTAYGYVGAVVECRGTGASFGVRVVTNSREEAEDGAEALDWIAEQPFCDGQVGTVSMSYKGQTQLEILSCKPKHMKAAFIGCTDYNKYDGWVRGCVPRAFGSSPDFNWGDTEEEIQANIDKVTNNTIPVDEDLDRVLLRQAVAGQVACGKQLPMMRDLNWRNSIHEEMQCEVWNVLSASTFKKEINDCGAAIYLAGGNYDVFRRDTFIIYQNLTCPKKLVFGPWYHVLPKVNPEWEPEILRWFDYWMKGIQNGIMDEEPMAIRVSNFDFANNSCDNENSGYYRLENSWPLHEGRRTCFYLSDAASDAAQSSFSGVLADAAPAAGGVDYKAVYGIKTSKESKFTTSPDGMGVDQKGAVFTTAPFTEEQTFIGHPMADITFSLEDPGFMEKDFDTDIFLTVSDYDPETGKAFEIDDGHLRASMRAEKENPYYDFLGLPWHEGNIGDNEYLELHKKYTLHIDLMPMSYCIKPGHCLRVTVSNAVDRMYYFGRLPFEADPQVKTPSIRIYTGGEDGSKIEMPNIYEK